MSNWFTGLFSSSNVATAASVAGAANPQYAGIINAASSVLGGSIVTQSAGMPQVIAAPVAPSPAVLAAAQQAIVTAQSNYNNLLAQVKAVEAYNAIMQQVTDAQVSGAK